MSGSSGDAALLRLHHVHLGLLTTSTATLLAVTAAALSVVTRRLVHFRVAILAAYCRRCRRHGIRHGEWQSQPSATFGRQLSEHLGLPPSHHQSASQE